MRIPENTKSNRDPVMVATEESRKNRHLGKRRRKGLGLLAYYLAGGTEQRHQTDRRYSQAVDRDAAVPPNKRSSLDRRRVVNTKYLNCGKIMDRRDDVRRLHDGIDETAAERHRYGRLGPGWL